MKEKPVQLARTLGFGALFIYGLGDILGAGIYSIIGKMAGYAGALTWLSFLIAMLVISMSALSYSELSSRYPDSGGVSVFVEKAFGRKWLSIFAGLLLFCATVFSMSTLSQAFTGYLATLGFDLSKSFSILCFFIVLMAINMRGIRQSSLANIISTCIEVSGLLIVLGCGLWFLLLSDHKPAVTAGLPGWKDVLKGVALAFFAFTGFEDLANVAEEAHEPQKNLPRALLSSLATAGILYLAVSLVATAVVPGTALGDSDAPLFDVVHTSAPAVPSWLFSLVAIFAVSNTALLNYITASRLLYGMSKARLMPNFLQTVHKKYQTPSAAILIIFPCVAGLGLTGNLGELAGATSAIVLMVFTLSCTSLMFIKWKEKKTKSNKNIFHIPFLIPCIAVILNMSALLFLPLKSLLHAGIFLTVSLILSVVFSGRGR